jgi:hypothetical protein
MARRTIRDLRAGELVTWRYASYTVRRTGGGPAVDAIGVVMAALRS